MYRKSMLTSHDLDLTLTLLRDFNNHFTPAFSCSQCF